MIEKVVSGCPHSPTLTEMRKQWLDCDIQNFIWLLTGMKREPHKEIPCNHTCYVQVKIVPQQLIPS